MSNNDELFKRKKVKNPKKFFQKYNYKVKDKDKDKDDINNSKKVKMKLKKGINTEELPEIEGSSSNIMNKNMTCRIENKNVPLNLNSELTNKKIIKEPDNINNIKNINKEQSNLDNDKEKDKSIPLPTFKIIKLDDNINKILKRKPIKLNKVPQNKSTPNLMNKNKQNEIINNINDNKIIDDFDKNNQGYYNMPNKDIQIILRIRPLSPKELSYSNITTLEIAENNSVNLICPKEYDYDYNGNGTKYLKNENNLVITKSQIYKYQFDFAFDETSSQSQIYQTSIKSIINYALNGYNSTILAYGATGAGKTYTMVGTGEQPGIMARLIGDIYRIISTDDQSNYKIEFSYIEIYNEIVNDLLSDTNNINPKIDIRNDPIKGVLITGVKCISVNNVKDAYKLLLRGNRNKKEEPNSKNERSSRSHSILEIIISKKISDKNNLNEKNQIFKNEKNENDSNIDADLLKHSYGKIFLVDLAGSERLSINDKPNNETQSINKSLLILANCMNALAKKQLIPWRESKLTRVLKDSLCGNSKILLISNVSPSVLSLDETFNTIKFASRVKNIQVEVKRNVIHVDNNKAEKFIKVISSLQKEIKETKKEILKNNIPNNLNGTFSKLNNNNISTLTDEHDLLISDINNHFDREIINIKSIIKYENYIIDMKNERYKQNFNKSENRVKDNKEFDNKILLYNSELTKLYIEQADLIKLRKPIQTKILILKNKKLNQIYKYYLSLIDNYKIEHRLMLLNKDIDRKNSDIDTLKDQITLRDDFLIKAKEEISGKTETNLTYNDNFIPIEEIDNMPYKPIKLIHTIDTTFKEEDNNMHCRYNSQDYNNINLNINSNNSNYNFLPLIDNNIVNSINNIQIYNAKYFNKRFNRNIEEINRSKIDNKYKLSSSKSENIFKINNNNINNNNINNIKFNVDKPTLTNNDNNNINDFSTIEFKSNFNNYHDSSFEINNSNYQLNNYVNIYNKKVKTLLCKNIIGRYNHSPYIKN